MANSRLILIEGMIGSGKTTTAERLADWLSGRGEDVRAFDEGAADPPIRTRRVDELLGAPAPGDNLAFVENSPWARRRNLRGRDAVVRLYQAWEPVVSQLYDRYPFGKLMVPDPSTTGRLPSGPSALPSAPEPGEPALAAFRRALLEEGGLLAQAEAGDREALARLRTVNRVIAESPALLAREQQAMTRSAADLAALLAAETGAPRDDLRPQVVANALLGLQRAVIDYVRGRVSSGDHLGGLAADVRKLTAEAFALLEQGLAGYDVRA